MVPDGMESHIHRFEPFEGGTFRISLTYHVPDESGKTTSDTDTYHGRFTKIVENQLVEQVVEFETSNPGMQGQMTIIYSLSQKDGGTVIEAVHKDLPPALSPSDNEAGWKISLGKLVALVEGRCHADSVR
jgi:uncharacterized protein YndB with AHSA1/START domain